MPYIYTVDELKRLLAATNTLQTPLSPLLALTMRTLLQLLYGTGMRIGEALALTLQDVDLENHVLTVRDTKFFKTRLVPIGPRLAMLLADYLARRYQLPQPDCEASAFLATCTGLHLDYKRVNKLFCRLRKVAEIRRETTASYQPRIHDIRHAAAVHRVIAWYRAGMDVQRLLPQLATYLGHVDVASTQPGALIRGRKQGIDFGAREKLDQGPREAFAGDGEHTLDLCGIGGRLESCVTKEGVDRREAQIPATNTHALTLLQVIQKRLNQGGIDLLEAQVRRRFMQPLVNELQKLAEGIAIGADRVRTRLALLHQTLGKETLQERS
jgi:hypothetical protein